MTRKNTGLHLYAIKPQTKSQEEAFDEFSSGQNLVMMGPAGAGKTIVAMYLALREVMSKKSNKLVIVRSAVPSRDIGFLPGSLEEKASLYEAPYADACSVIFGRDDAYDCLKRSNQVAFMTTSYARGINVRDSILFVDEASNMTFHECDTMITRAAEGTRVIVCGDRKQSDLECNQHEDFVKFCDVLGQMKSFSTIVYGIEDVMRSELVREYLRARQRVLKW